MNFAVCPRTANSGLAFVAPGTPTLADVLRAVQDAPKGTVSDRANVASAVRIVARALELPPEAAPAHPGFLRPRLARVAPAAHGLSAGRWANVRSLLRRALAVAGVDTLPGRHLAPLAPAWAEPASRLGTKALYNGLRRLMGYCSARGIDPSDVDDAVMDEFRRALEGESLLRNPRAAGLGAIRAWNRAAETVPGWPSRRLAAPPRRQGYTLPWSAFPEPFRTDVEAWLAELAGPKPLRTMSFGRVKPSTVAQRRLQSSSSPRSWSGRAGPPTACGPCPTSCGPRRSRRPSRSSSTGGTASRPAESSTSPRWPSRSPGAGRACRRRTSSSSARSCATARCGRG